MTNGAYRHFIFDFDGVICDSRAAAAEVFNDLREDIFSSLPSISTREDFELVYAGSLRTCLHRWLTEADARKFFDMHSARMAARATSLPAFEGIGEALSGLGHAAASIVTSAYGDAVRCVLAAAKVNDGVIFRVAGRELRQTKTEKIQSILSELQLEPTRVVYVGDLESDILYCRDVPIDIIAVGYGYHSGGYLASKSPTYAVETVTELAELLNHLRKEES